MSIGNKLQLNCIKFCKSEGLYHINTRGNKADTHYPNMVVCVNGLFVAFLFESSPEQEAPMKRLVSCGGRVFRPHTLGEFVKIIRDIQKIEQ